MDGMDEKKVGWIDGWIYLVSRIVECAVSRQVCVYVWMYAWVCIAVNVVLRTFVCHSWTHFRFLGYHISFCWVDRNLQMVVQGYVDRCVVNVLTS